MGRKHPHCPTLYAMFKLLLADLPSILVHLETGPGADRLLVLLLLDVDKACGFNARTHMVVHVKWPPYSLCHWHEQVAPLGDKEGVGWKSAVVAEYSNVWKVSSRK